MDYYNPGLLQATIIRWPQFDFRNDSRNYGLHIPCPPQLVLPTPSARTIVGTTKVLSRITAVATVRTKLFIGGFLL
jgi:hypothetical protein